MSKELKLRLWDGKKMINLFDPAIATRATSLNVIFTNNFFDLWHSKEIIDRGEISEYKLIEYTDHKDKNGNDIFDGDILDSGGETGYLGENVFVNWNKDELSWAVSTKDNNFRDRLRSCFSDKRIVWEVIGNIYQNPELLESHKKGGSGE